MEQNEILEETRRTNELLRGQLLWTRVAAALLAVLLTAVVVCLGNTMNSMGRISAALEGVDLAAVAEQVSKLDMDAVNRAISTLDGKISQMDVQAFNDAVAKLNGAVDALQSASDAVKAGAKASPAAWRACSASRSSAKTKTGAAAFCGRACFGFLQPSCSAR